MEISGSALFEYDDKDGQHGCLLTFYNPYKGSNTVAHLFNIYKNKV